MQDYQIHLLQKEFLKSAQYSLRNRVTHCDDYDNDDYDNDNDDDSFHLVIPFRRATRVVDQRLLHHNKSFLLFSFIHHSKIQALLVFLLNLFRNHIYL